jgi:hypothetical protein
MMTVLQMKNSSSKYFSYQLEYRRELDFVNSEVKSGPVPKTY